MMDFDFDFDNCHDDMLNDEFDDILNDINNYIDIDPIIEVKPYTCEEFINNFPKHIFFQEKFLLFKFFLDKGYSFYSINYIIYNQYYICNIINHPNFNDFLGLLFEKYKENINFFSDEDIFKFIIDNKYNFFNHILNCNKFYDEIYVEEYNLDINIINIHNSLEDVD